MQPGLEHRILGELPGPAAKLGEDLLRDVGRELRVAVGATQCRGVHEVHMTPDQFGEGGLGPFP